MEKNSGQIVDMGDNRIDANIYIEGVSVNLRS